MAGRAEDALFLAAGAAVLIGILGVSTKDPTALEAEAYGVYGLARVDGNAKSWAISKLQGLQQAATAQQATQVASTIGTWVSALGGTSTG